MDVEDDKPAGPTDPNDLSAYNLDNYDEEVSRGTGKCQRELGRQRGENILTCIPCSAMGAFSNLGGLKVHQDINDDPYITLKEDVSLVDPVAPLVLPAAHRS